MLGYWDFESVSLVIRLRGFVQYWT